MKKASDIINLARMAGRKKRLYSSHSLQQLIKPDRMITTGEIRSVIEHGELIEDYPGDKRGHPCLISGKGNAGRFIHVVCSPKDEYLAIITAYIPDGEEWDKNFRLRVKK